MCFSHYFFVVFFHKRQRNKTKTVCFCTTVLFCTTVPFLYHCSVFVPLFRFVLLFRLCTTVPFFRTTVPFFALLFRFSQETRGQKRNNVFFALLFRYFFHKEQRNKTKQCGCFNLCSVFFFSYENKETKTEQCVFVPLFRFRTSVPFFQTNRKDLIQCLEGKEMRPVPTAKGTSKR